MIHRSANGENIQQYVDIVSENQGIANIDFSIQSINDDNGQIIALLSQSKDISKIKEVEIELSEAKERSRKSFANAGIGMLVTSLEGHLLEVNPSFCSMIGYNEDELLKCTLFDVTHPEDHKISQNALASLVEDKDLESTQIEKRYIHKDGYTVWARVSAFVIRDENMKCKYGVVHVQDYSDKIRIEQALKESETKYQVVVESLEEGVFFRTKTESFAVNESAKRILGLNEEDFSNPASIDPNWYLTRPDKTKLPSEEEPIVIALKTGKVQQGILVGVHKPDDDFIWISANAQPLFHLDEDVPYAAVASFHDITKLKQQEEELVYQAFHDSLTALPNRKLFFDRLEQAINNISRDQGPHAILYLDLDRFKYVNDTFGHDIGDSLLSQVAERLDYSVRSVDTVARFGGDEFALLLVNVKSPHNLFTLVKRIQTSIQQPYIINDHTLNIDLSIGISLTTMKSSNGEVLLHNADLALRQAKQNGKGQYLIFDKEMSIKEKMSLSLEQDLRKALEKNQLVVFYQPIVSISQQKIIGAEALMRWQHPERGLILPEEFIPLAEDTGLIVPMGKWLTQESLKQLKAWLEQGIPIYLSLNISARQLKDEDLISFFKNILIEKSILPTSVTLELTETLVMDKVIEHSKRLQGLANLGLTITVDDFGTGYSSLGHLKDLPVTELKIDRSFFKGVPSNAVNTKLVTAIFSLARQLNLSVVAEGIESVEQLELLKQQDCEKAQGYYFGKPMPLAEFESIVQG